MTSKPELQHLSLIQLVPGRYQPRRQFDQTELAALAESICAAGVIQPIVVRPLEGGQYEIVAGERRWRAAQIAQHATVPCLVKSYTDEQMAAVTTIENITRVDLNPIEEAHAYQHMIDDFGYLHEELAAVVGKSRSHITNQLRLLTCAPPVQHYLITGQLSQGHGKALAGLTAPEQITIAHRAVKQGWSVRRIEKAVKAALAPRPNTTAPLDPNLETLEKALGDHLGCAVTINHQQDAGCQLQIDCHDLDILQGIFEKLGFKTD